MSSRKPFAALSSPQAWSLFYRAIAIFFGAVLGWIILVAILSLLNAWFVVLLTIGLGVAVFVRDQSAKQREAWIDEGCCAACGNSLSSPPGICSVCGRDGALDEPTWRKLRRDHETRKAAEAAHAGGPPPVPIPVIPLPRPVRRTVVEDSEPIPLEPENPMTKVPNPNQIPDPSDLQ